MLCYVKCFNIISIYLRNLFGFNKMNQRIQELMLKAGFIPRITETPDGQLVHEPVFNAEKFAELIIQDCMDVVDGCTKPRTFGSHYEAVKQIEALFGIKHNGIKNE
jgi:hypothetical protein